MRSDVNISEDKSSNPPYEKDAGIHTTPDTEMGRGDIETIETTKRGLKARHAQMIALGGTIGKSFLSLNLIV